MNKLLLLATVGRSLYSKWLLGELLAGVIVLVMLSIITSVMISAMVIASIYACYLLLLSYGFLPHAAFFITGALVAVIGILFFILTFMYLRHLRAMPQKLLRKKLPLTAHANDILKAFLDGFQTPAG